MRVSAEQCVPCDSTTFNKLATLHSAECHSAECQWTECRGARLLRRLSKLCFIGPLLAIYLPSSCWHKTSYYVHRLVVILAQWKQTADKLLLENIMLQSTHFKMSIVIPLKIIKVNYKLKLVLKINYSIKLDNKDMLTST
jgi:hypothetical protein